MKIIKIFLLIAIFTSATISCSDQLDVKNPNEPTAEVLTSEAGILKFALAGVYINGFVDLKFVDGVVGPFWANGFFDLMADNIGGSAANVFMNQIGCPEVVILDDDTEVPNPNAPSHQPDMLRQNNLNANQSQNPLVYEWSYMYALNRSCNYILSAVDGITFSGDATTKKELLKAWAYWWKGFAYSRIGSIYYSALIVDNPLVITKPEATNGNYKLNTEILAEAENNFAKAEAILNTLTDNGDYNQVLGKIIPGFNQVGNGGILSPDMWIRNINTMRARNIIANKRVENMTGADWDQIISLTTNGISPSDFVFTGRANENGDFLSSQAGSVSAKATGDPKNSTYKISERLIQSFDPADKRLANNFSEIASAWIGNTDRGNSFNTRWQLRDGGNDLPDVIVYSNKTPGEYELFMAGSYEENELMKAEANIYKNNIAAGTTIIDAIRNYQGAGLASIGTVTQQEAIDLIRSERRVALLFRSVAFYDARRYGIIDPVASGGGVKGAVVIDDSGNVNTNATIDYQFLDYWDVPDNETVYNPPTAGSAPVKNPKQ
jgi:hypothetical protein